MANETLIARLEQSLRQSRGARTRLAARLAELESECEIIRSELAEMDTLSGQTEAAIYRLLSNVMNGPSTAVGTTSVGELEVEFQRRLAHAELSQNIPLHPPQRHNVPAVRSNIEPMTDRFFDRVQALEVGYLARADFVSSSQRRIEAATGHPYQPTNT